MRRGKEERVCCLNGSLALLFKSEVRMYNSKFLESSRDGAWKIRTGPRDPGTEGRPTLLPAGLILTWGWENVSPETSSSANYPRVPGLPESPLISPEDRGGPDKNPSLLPWGRSLQWPWAPPRTGSAKTHYMFKCWVFLPLPFLVIGQERTQRNWLSHRTRELNTWVKYPAYLVTLLDIRWQRVFFVEPSQLCSARCISE